MEEQQIFLEPEMAVIGGGAVSSVNGYTGDVVLTTSDLENTSDYQTGSEVQAAISIETTAREAADNNLQTQIDAISASSDVTDIVGTYAELQNYDTSTLGDNDIIKVLQDESQNGETTYYRWSTTTQSFTLIGEEGPYYTKAQADALLNAKQDTLTAGANIQISNNTISATDTTYSDFTGTDGTSAGAAGLVPAPATTDAGKFLKADGTWDDAGSAINVVQTTGTSTTSVMSQNATTGMVFADPATQRSVRIGNSRGTGAYSVNIGYSSGSGSGSGYVTGTYSVGVGANASIDTGSDYSVVIGSNSQIGKYLDGDVALGAYSGSNITAAGMMDIGSSNTTYGYNTSNYRLLTGLYDPQNDHDAATKGYVDTAVAGAGGGVTELTADDYNWPTANPDGVALWRLSPGLYNWDNGVKVYTSASSSNTNGASAFVTEAAGNAREYVEVVRFYPGGANNTYNWSKVNYNTGAVFNNIDNAHLLSDKSVVNSLTSTSTTAPLSANQGKILNDKIVGVTSTITIRSHNWSALADSSPYNYQHTAIFPDVSNDSSLELVNNNPVLFAKHGFAIAGVTLSSSSIANVTIYSIGVPDDTVALNIIRRG